MKQAISISSTRGLLHIPWDTEITPGAYISEYEDANGVYYRAPEGALTERRTDEKETSRAGRTLTFDGGIYVPNDPATAPTLYEYYATMSLRPDSAPSDTDCSTLTYTVDPNTQKVSVMRTGVAFGAGAAIGMTTGRFVHPHVHTSYGQAAGVGLAGGLIAGLIIGAIEKSKEGEILPGPALDSPAEEKIKTLVTNKVALGELPQAGISNVAAAAPAPPAPAAPATQVAAPTTGASGGVETAAMPAPAVPAATSAPATAAALAAAPATAVSPAPANVVAEQSMQSLAQNVATQMGCGAVKADGDSAYVAPCGENGVYIGCDAGQCRPLHTIKLEGDQ
ncbi:hypothetical protein [Dyella mobilis]|uniref:Uncharacterized protein n=1 Tax=Dyella mobilis TaxID=1849582 RepID=A0ABS2KDJ3_9GAMM|nr:hypothetical protein [Dyella mobilis]MBM7129004.1 hypothetical protein [Dyella mobilis]